jgi:hypothetical protein
LANSLQVDIGGLTASQLILADLLQVDLAFLLQVDIGGLAAS